MTEYLTTDEVAAKMRRTRDYVQKLCKQQRLPAIKLGTEWRIAEDDFAAFMRTGHELPATRTRRRAS